MRLRAALCALALLLQLNAPAPASAQRRRAARGMRFDRAYAQYPQMKRLLRQMP
ncbi:MAG TPA: hypothetical protein VGB98_04320 [Pyrinomonadaceae bacterium]